MGTSIETIKETDKILDDVISIKSRSGLTNSKLREFMDNMNETTFRNKLSKGCKTNYFRESDLLNLKSGVKKHFENYNHN